ncbi:hypothetical protein ACLB2K_051193 [Fragaria x ananassa]
MAGEDETTKDTKSSNQTPAWENSNHALYLHHSDQPGAVLVSQALEEDNYVEWKQSMASALTIKNKIGFVNGTLPCPQFNEEEKTQWTRCNALVKNWLENSMSKQIRKSVVHCKDARSVWLELQERFSQTNTVNLFNIETAIHECVQEGNSVTSFFTNLKALWDEKDALCTSTPCTCAAATEAATALETQRTMKFLMGLNDDYAAVRSTIIGIDPLPTLNKAYAMVLRQEKQAAVSGNRGSSSAEAAAFYSSKEDREAWKKNSNKIDGSKCANPNEEAAVLSLPAASNGETDFGGLVSKSQKIATLGWDRCLMNRYCDHLGCIGMENLRNLRSIGIKRGCPV